MTLSVIPKDISASVESLPEFQLQEEIEYLEHRIEELNESTDSRFKDAVSNVYRNLLTKRLNRLAILADGQAWMA